MRVPVAPRAYERGPERFMSQQQASAAEALILVDKSRSILLRRDLSSETDAEIGRFSIHEQTSTM